MGTFDTSNRQLKLELREPLRHWNECAKRFNDAWEEYLTFEKQMKTCSPIQFDWTRNQVETNLKKAQDMPKHLRTTQSQLAEIAPGKNQHPAVKVEDEEIKRAIEMVRDARDALDAYAESHGFAQKVEKHVANARAAYAEAQKSRPTGDSCYHVEGFNGNDYKFGTYGHGSGYQLQDILRVALGECEVFPNPTRFSPPLILTLNIIESKRNSQ
jgi:hypothetical protein